MDKKRIELIKKFNKLDRERKNLYWKIDTLNDNLYFTRVDLRKKFSRLKTIFYKYKQNKDLINPEILEKLKENLKKFNEYVEKRIKADLETID